MDRGSIPIIPMRQIKQQVLGLDLLRRLAERNQRIFSTEHMVAIGAELGLKEKDVAGALVYLQQEEWIAAIRRGLYALITALPPNQPASPYDIAASLVTPAAFSHWTALEMHQLSVQPSPYYFVLTHTQPSLPRHRRKGATLPPAIYPVGPFHYRFVQIKPEKFFGVEEHSGIQVTNLERTLWDAVMMPQLVGGWANVEAAFHNAKDRIDLARLLDYAGRGDIATSKRLGWLLEYHGIDAEALRPLLDKPIKGFRLLDASAPAVGPCNQRWMIQVNTLEERESGVRNQESE